MKTRTVFRSGLLLVTVTVALSFALAWTPDRPVEELARKWAPEPSRFIGVKGLQVHVRDEGPRDDPAPLVLIHGTSASLHTWESWVAVLKAQRRVITMDLPGFGLTGPNAQADYRSEAYTQFIIDLLDTLNVQRCILGGNSLGGDIAWQVALAAPQRVERLILVDAGGYPLQPESMPIGFQIASTPVLSELMVVALPRFMVAASVRDVYGDPSRVTPRLVDRYEALTLRQGNRRALVQRFAQSNFGEHAARIPELKMPVLLLWGGRDRLIPVAHGHQFKRDIADSELVIFDDLGHVPHEEDPVRTVKAVQAFLQRAPA